MDIILSLREYSELLILEVVVFLYGMEIVYHWFMTVGTKSREWQLFYFLMSLTLTVLSQQSRTNLPPTWKTRHQMIWYYEIEYIIIYTGIVRQSYHIIQKGPSWPWSYGSWIYNYLFSQCLSPLTFWIRTTLMARCTRYNIMWWSFSVTCDRSVVFSGYSGFLHQYNWLLS
jgi:hypothetical protein